MYDKVVWLGGQRRTPSGPVLWRCGSPVEGDVWAWADPDFSGDCLVSHKQSQQYKFADRLCELSGTRTDGYVCEHN